MAAHPTSDTLAVSAIPIDIVNPVGFLSATPYESLIEKLSLSM